MHDCNRRKFVKTGVGSAAIGTIPGMASAKSSTNHDESVQIEDITVISKTSNQAFVGVSVKNNGVNEHRIFTVDPASGSVRGSEVQKDQYQSLTSGVSVMSHTEIEAEIAREVNTQQDIIKRSGSTHERLDSCGSFDGLTHLQGTVYAEFTRDLSDLSITVISTAIIAYLGSTNLPGLVIGILSALVAGGTWMATWLLDVDALTWGFKEWDLWWQPRIAKGVTTGYGKDVGDLVKFERLPVHGDLDKRV